MVDHPRAAELDHHVLGVALRREQLAEVGGGGEEQAAFQLVHLPALRVGAGRDADGLGVLPGEHQRGKHHAAQHRHRQVGEHGDQRHADDDDRILTRDLAQRLQAAPGKGLLRHHQHQPDQRRQRDLLDPRRQEQDEAEQEQRGDDAGQAVAGAVVDVDHALPDQHAAAHGGEQAGHHVAAALRQCRAVGLAAAVGDVVDQVQRQQ
ncbi:hypothetical protein D3C85_1355270 [compost metagenome]